MSVQTDTRYLRRKKNDVNRRAENEQGQRDTPRCRNNSASRHRVAYRDHILCTESYSRFCGGGVRGYVAESSGRYAGQQHASPTAPMGRFAKSSFQPVQSGYEVFAVSDTAGSFNCAAKCSIMTITNVLSERVISSGAKNICTLLILCGRIYF